MQSHSVVGLIGTYVIATSLVIVNAAVPAPPQTLKPGGSDAKRYLYLKEGKSPAARIPDKNLSLKITLYPDKVYGVLHQSSIIADEDGRAWVKLNDDVWCAESEFYDYCNMTGGVVFYKEDGVIDIWISDNVKWTISKKSDYPKTDFVPVNEIRYKKDLQDKGVLKR